MRKLLFSLVFTALLLFPITWGGFNGQVSASEKDFKTFRTDINGDGIVNMVDVATVARAVSSYPSDLRWNSAADVNHDGSVGIIDLISVVRDFGRACAYYDFDSLANWNVASGNWSIVNGILASSETTQGLIFAQGKTWKDCILTARVKVEAESPDADTAFCFHFIDQWNFYWAGIGSWGHKFSIGRTIGNVSEELTSVGDKADVVKGIWYIISIRVSGSTMALYINSVLELVVEDLTFARGMIGMRSSHSRTLVDYVLVSGVLSSGHVGSNTYVVALDGSGDFADIQNAIDAIPLPLEGKIEIKDGVYDLNPAMMYPFKSIVVRSNLTIRGMGIDRTVIRSFPTRQPFGSGTRAMTITSRDKTENLVIENLTVVQNGTPDNMGLGAIYLRTDTNKNITIRNIKVTDVTGGAIGITRFDNILVENCIVERVWTGIALGGGSNGLVRSNKIVNTRGDGVFPQGSNGLSVTDLTIEDNYLENIGDTGIDITSTSGLPPHERIVVLNNTLKNAVIRVSHAQHVELRRNIIEGGQIIVDNGVGPAINITVEGNKITTSYGVGIGFYGAQDCYATENEVYMTAPAGDIVQAGISVGIWGTGLIEENIIVNSSKYGIDFAEWGLGGDSNITIRRNTILDSGDIGIFDNALDQGRILIENNTIWDRRNPFASRYGIRTDYEANKWTIRFNTVYGGRISFISAPNSNVYSNIYQAPLASMYDVSSLSITDDKNAREVCHSELARPTGSFLEVR